jgi:hypothetical protein
LVSAKDAHLFAPRAAYRLRNVEPPFAVSHDPSAGRNPETGVPIHFWLRSETKDSIALGVQDAAGKTVRSIKAAPGKAGINRVWWNLRYDATKESKLRTPPQYAPDMKVGADGRTAPDGVRFALLAPPGSYTVKLTAGGQDMTQRLDLRKDPNSGGSEEEIRTQTALLLTIRSDLESVAVVLLVGDGMAGDRGAVQVI